MTKNQAVVCDLDDTLVDTHGLAVLRKSRKWAQCIAGISETRIHPGVSEVLDILRDREVKVGVVTTSTSNYARPVLEHHATHLDAFVAYHDCRWNQQKPHPTPTLLCLSRLGCQPTAALGVGDSRIDATAYRKAGLIALGAGWSEQFSHDADWSHVLETPSLLLKHVIAL